MAPLGGIKITVLVHPLFQSLLVLLLTWSSGNVFCTISQFLIIFNIAQFAVRYWLMNLSYKMGNAITLLTENAKEFTRAASYPAFLLLAAWLSATVEPSWRPGANIPNGETHSVVLSGNSSDGKQLASWSGDCSLCQGFLC